MPVSRGENRQAGFFESFDVAVEHRHDFIAASHRIGAIFWTKVSLIQIIGIYQALTDRLPVVAVAIVALSVWFFGFAENPPRIIW